MNVRSAELNKYAANAWIRSQSATQLSLQPSLCPFECELLMSNVARTRLLKELLQQRILILDGAMGTMIQSYKLA